MRMPARSRGGGFELSLTGFSVVGTALRTSWGGDRHAVETPVNQRDLPYRRPFDRRTFATHPAVVVLARSRARDRQRWLIGRGRRCR